MSPDKIPCKALGARAKWDAHHSPDCAPFTDLAWLLGVAGSGDGLEVEIGRSCWGALLSNPTFHAGLGLMMPRLPATLDQLFQLPPGTVRLVDGEVVTATRGGRAVAMLLDVVSDQHLGGG